MASGMPFGPGRSRASQLCDRGMRWSHEVGGGVARAFRVDEGDRNSSEEYMRAFVAICTTYDRVTIRVNKPLLAEL